MRPALLAGGAVFVVVLGLAVGFMSLRDPGEPAVVVAVPLKAPPRAVPVAVAVPAAPKPPAQVEVRFLVKPAEATVHVDGAVLTGPTVKLVSGHASAVVVSAAGFATRELSLSPTRDDVVEVALEPLPAPKKAVAPALHPPGKKAARHKGDKLIMDKGDVFN